MQSLIRSGQGPDSVHTNLVAPHYHWWQLMLKTSLNDMMDDRPVFSNASRVNLMIWYYLDDQQLAGVDERWTVSDCAFYAAHDYRRETTHQCRQQREECENVSG